jgi:ribosomal subunit interface protein
MPAITIKASPHSLLSDSIRGYIQKKMDSFEKFLREENTIHVDFDSDKHRSGIRYHVEIRIDPGSTVFAEAIGEDLYEAIDLCMPKLKEQLTRRKDRRVASRRKEGFVRKESIEDPNNLIS